MNDPIKGLSDRIGLLESILKIGNQYMGVKWVVRIRSLSVDDCILCGKQLSDFQGGVNHYLREHGFVILHVGAEAMCDPVHGEIDQQTVAILGSKADAQAKAVKQSVKQEQMPRSGDDRVGRAFADAVEDVAAKLIGQDKKGSEPLPDVERLPF